MSSIVVSTPAALLAALKSAASGGLILLTPGPWEPVAIFDYHAPNNGVVTISSQSVTNPAVLPGLVVNLSSGLNFYNLTLATTLRNAPTSLSAPTPFVVENSQRITLSQLSVHGPLGGDPQDDVNCLMIETSDQVVVTDSEFQQCFNAIGDLYNTHITISANSIHDIRNDGIDNGGSSDVTISGNRLTNFYPVGAVGTTGDHADAIQFWTTGTVAPAHDITITNNSFVRGSGHWVQGIFVTDQVGLPFERVTITGNTIDGGEYNGIMVSGCAGLVVGGNMVQPYTDLMSWVRIDHCVAANVTDNRAGLFRYTGDAGLALASNLVIRAVPPPKPPSGASAPAYQ